MNNFQTRYQKLNQDQKKAVDNIEGPVLVVAGPGSGKTELLSLRTANILENTQMNPGNILLLTFTESGAKNMRERIVGMIGEAGYRVAIYTFHAFASDVINKYSEYFFDGATFRPATEIEKISIIESILEALPRDNPLSVTHTEKGYIYLYDVISCISALKKGNLNGIEFKEKVEIYKKEIEDINKKVSKFFLNIAGKSKYEVLRDAFLEIYNELKTLKEKENATAKFLLDTLTLEIKQAEEIGKGTNLTKWKNEYFTKDEYGNFILKDSREEKIKKWISLGEVYDKYNFKMYEEGLYDFDDMIFKVARTLKENVALRAELAEKYQYIMIDEFQDTSDVQFDLIVSLASDPVNENRPNILAVGDDDQAIFKFQGAELDNITKFINTFDDVLFIVLKENYRSTQNILDEARKLIIKIDDRLETRFPGKIDKNIQASNKDLIPGEIIEKSFDNPHLEKDFIAKEIQNILKNKKLNPKEISIISKSHANLKEMANVLNEYNIPYSYEKEENVFDKQPTHELITIIDFVSSGMENLKEELLPEILSYNFWNIERIEIWKIAEKVKEGEIEKDEFGEKIYKRVSWLSVMLKSDNLKIKNIANFLIELIADAESLPLLHLIDKIIGTREWEIDTEIDDNDKIEKIETNFTSPLREYYFGKDNFDHNKPEYLDFLFALRTFIGALREYKTNNILYAKDLGEFISIYENNKNLSLSTISPFATSDESIVLQTAHKSKGLEYEYVFILNSDENEWNSRGLANKINMPITLPLLPVKDDISDRIRLYYVAITRAKHTLYITHNKEKFSKLLKEEELNEKKEKKIKEKIEIINKEILNSLEIKEKRLILEDEEVLLKRLLENYKMPVTHLINFLNIGKVGPEKFIEQNLLRFPQALSPSSVYGSAMHKAVENYFRYKKKYEKSPAFEKVIGYFKNALNMGALNKIDFDKYYDSGVKNLEIYIKYLEGKEYNIKTEVEANFKNEGVILDGALLTGKIDKIEIEGNKIKVTDLKTGKSFKSWDENDNAYDKIKLHFFKYQLAFYNILLKNSRTYNNFEFENANIEFVEADSKNKINVLNLNNDKEFDEIILRVKALIRVIYKKIMNLDFPNTDIYKINEKTGEEKSEISLKDIEKFEEDLLNDNI